MLRAHRGLVPATERVESPAATPIDTTEERVAAFVDRNEASIELWEAVAHVRRFEATLGREIDEDEMEDLLSCLMMAYLQVEQFTKALAGAGAVFPMFEDAVFVPREDRERLALWRAHYERERAERKAKSA